MSTDHETTVTHAAGVHEIDAAGVHQIVAEIWESMLGLPVEASDEACGGGREVRAAVQITGGWEGAFIIECPEASAVAFTVAMLGYEAGEEPEPSEVHDVVGELANMAGGNLKAIVAAESRLSLPTVTVGVRYAVSGETAVYADATSARDLIANAAPGLYNTKVGMEWQPAKSRFGFEGRSLGIQLQSGYRMSLRVKSGGLGISFRGNF